MWKHIAMARGNVHTKTENRSKYKHCVCLCVCGTRETWLWTKSIGTTSNTRERMNGKSIAFLLTKLKHISLEQWGKKALFGAGGFREGARGSRAKCYSEIK